MGERDAVELLGPVGAAKVGLCLEASDGVGLVSLPQHDGKRLVVLPATGQVDVGVQEIAEYGREQVGVEEGERKGQVKSETQILMSLWTPWASS